MFDLVRSVECVVENYLNDLDACSVLKILHYGMHQSAEALEAKYDDPWLSPR